MIARLAHRTGVALSAASLGLMAALYADYTSAATLDPPGAWNGLTDLQRDDWFGPCLPEEDLETAWARHSYKGARAPRTCLTEDQRSYSAFEWATGTPLDRGDRETVVYVRTREECPQCNRLGTEPVAPVPLPGAGLMLAGALGMIFVRSVRG